MKPPYDDIKRWKELPEKTYSYTEALISLTEVSTSSKTIEEGDKLWITGKVINPYSNYPVTVRVIDPSGSVLIDKEIRLDQYNQYRLSLVADSSLMTQAGSFKVIVYYFNLVRTTTFSYTTPAEIVQPTTVSPKPSELPVYISFSTDKTKYQNDDIIIISGKVNNFKENAITYFQINGPSGILRALEEINFDSRGEFYTYYPVNKIPTLGYHTLTIKHQNIEAKTAFNISNPVPASPQPTPVTPSQLTPVTPQQPDPVTTLQDKGKLELANLRFKQFEKATTTFALGKEVKITYLIKNSQERGHSFDLKMEVINESGKSKQDMLVPGSIRANQEFHHSPSWYPEESGKQQIKISILDKDNHSIQLAPPLKMWITVKDNESQPKIAPTSESKPTCGLGTVLKNGLCIVEDNDPYEQKAKQAKSIYENKIGTLYSGIEKAATSLHESQFDKPDAQKKVEEGWKIREMARDKFEQIKVNSEQAYLSFGRGDYKHSYELFQKIESLEDSMDEDLKWVSKAIDDAKKLDESICFLNWCFVNPFSNW